MIRNTATVSSTGLMEDHTEAIGLMESNMAEESTEAPMDKNEKVNGSADRKQDGLMNEINK